MLNPLLRTSPHSSKLGFVCESRILRKMNTTVKTRKPKPVGYKKILEAKSDEIRRSLSAQKASGIVHRLDIPSDEGDLSQQHHEEWIFLNRNSLDMKLLREVADALRRIERDSYGICLECQEAISPKRLDAVPWARYCVACQELIAARLASGEPVDELQEA
jgi:DnaK suppressor protein